MARSSRDLQSLTEMKRLLEQHVSAENLRVLFWTWQAGWPARYLSRDAIKSKTNGVRKKQTNKLKAMRNNQ